MSDVPSPIEVTSWPQVAALALILAFMAIPSLIGYLTTSRTARGARDNANAAAEVAGEVKQTLTENNGGSSVKDYLDRIEARLDRIEGTTTTTDEENYSDAPNP